MRVKEYIIEGSPIAWKRTGLNDKRFYDRQMHEKLAIGLFFQQQHGNEEPFEDPLEVEMLFYLPILAKYKGKTGYYWHTTLPDLDNLQKFILDTITQTTVVWKDDRQVSSIIAKKMHDCKPRTHIIVRELGDWLMNGSCKNEQPKIWSQGDGHCEETPKTNTAGKKQTKSGDAPYDPDMIYSYRQYPISKAIVDKMIEELPDWPLKNPIAISISEFYLSRNISEGSYYRLLEKYPELKECHKVALLRLGNSLYKSAVFKNADWSAVKHRLYNYGESFEKDYKFHAQIKAEADKNVNTGTQYIEIPVYTTPKPEEKG